MSVNCILAAVNVVFFFLPHNIQATLNLSYFITVRANESKKNQTWISGDSSMPSFIPNKEALIRSSYVFGGLCFLAILYFVFRTCRLRRRRGTARRTGTRKYHPLNAGTGNQEMEPLGDGGDDDEDEDTLFDTSQPSSTAQTTPSFGI